MNTRLRRKSNARSGFGNTLASRPLTVYNRSVDGWRLRDCNSCGLSVPGNGVPGSVGMAARRRTTVLFFQELLRDNPSNRFDVDCSVRIIAKCRMEDSNEPRNSVVVLGGIDGDNAHRLWRDNA